MITLSEVTRVLRLANTLHGPSSAHPVGPYGEPANHDHLSSGQVLREFLELHQVVVPAGVPNDAQVSLMRSLREAALTLVSEPEPVWRERLEPLSRHFVYRLAIDGSLQPIPSGWDGFIAATFVELLRLGSERDRVRLCDEDACRWLFLDDSKNLQRRWCEMSTCGSRAKMRRYRARRRAGADDIA